MGASGRRRNQSTAGWFANGMGDGKNPLELDDRKIYSHTARVEIVVIRISEMIVNVHGYLHALA